MIRRSNKFCRISRTGVMTMAAVIVLSANCEAQMTYDFIGEFVRQGPGTVTSGDVLATIEFSDFPARHDDVLSLTFTTAGDELFGLGLTFDDEFAVTAGALIPDGATGLVSSNPAGGGYTAVIEDDESSLHDARALILGTSTAGGPVNTLGLQLGTALPFIVSGRFELVPEPGAGLLGLIASIFGLSMRHRRDPRGAGTRGR